MYNFEIIIIKIQLYYLTENYFLKYGQFICKKKI